MSASQSKTLWAFSRSADFQVGCVADFHIRAVCEIGPPADLEIGDTAGLDTRVTISERDLQVASAGESKQGGNCNSDGEAA